MTPCLRATGRIANSRWQERAMGEFLRLARFAAAFKWWMALAVLLGAGTIGAGIGLMAASAYLISAAALHPSIAELNLAIVGVRFFGIARAGLRYLERLAAHSISLRLLTALRVWFYNALEPLAPARLQPYRSGDILTRAVADIDTLQDFYVRVLAPPLVALVIALGMGAFLWQFDARLAVVLWGAWLAAGIGLPALARRAAHHVTQTWSAQRAAMHAQLVDALQGIADITAFGQREAVKTRAAATSAAYAAAQMRLAQINALQAGAENLLTQLTLIAVLVVGIAAVNAGEFRAVYLAALALATIAAFEAVTPLPQTAQALEHATAAARRLFEIVDANADGSRAPRARRIEIERAHEHARGAILLKVRDLKFAYAAGETNALDGISFALARGEKIAIVGPSGAGKSTLVNLLARFWEYDAGEIYLEGKPLREFSADAVRDKIGVISQRTYLFNASVRDNLRLAKPDATDDEIVRAARRAQIHSFVERLPRGYDTPIGERGAALSGGERQRLGIARVLLRDTPLLILDEPTAQLDAPTERALLREIFRLLDTRALLLLTHRLVGLEEMDEILVLERGHIVERGKHADLLARGGLYARMWHLQNQALDQDPSVQPSKGETDDFSESIADIPVFRELESSPAWRGGAVDRGTTFGTERHAV
jgi:ATP-binding cassette subfamily C protein CydC